MKNEKTDMCLSIKNNYEQKTALQIIIQLTFFKY